VRHLQDTPLIFAGPMWRGLAEWASAQMLRPGFELAGPQDMQIPSCVDGGDQAVAVSVHITRSGRRGAAMGNRNLDHFERPGRGLARCTLLLMTSLLLSGCYYGYYRYGYGGYPYEPYVTQQPYYGHEPYAGGSADQSYGQPAALDPNNCGTPDEPKPCDHRYR
jgi:hypothetical protein